MFAKAHPGSLHFVTLNFFSRILENFALVSSFFSFGDWRLLFRNTLCLYKDFILSFLKKYICMIYIYPIAFCFSLFFNRVTALDLYTKCVSPKYLPNKWLHFEKILYRHWYRGGVVWDCKWANFIQKQRSLETTELWTELNRWCI